MAEHVEQTPEVGPPAMGRDQDAQVSAIFDEVGRDERFRSLGLAESPEAVVQAVLCATWRNLPLRQLDTVRGLLPAGIDLMFGCCDLPAHGRHSAPRSFFRDSFLNDVAQHLGIASDRALVAATCAFQVLRAHMDDDEVEEADLFGASPDLLEFLQRRV